jgi:RNA polymerase sigma factor (TIGR02999 family)
MAQDDRPITDFLRILATGKREGLDGLVEILYSTLWRMCRSHLRNLPVGSLTPTALLNELYIDLANRFPELANRKQFFAYAHRAIEHVAVSSLRKDKAKKRGGGLHRVDLEEVDLPDEREGSEMVEVFEVLSRIEEQDPQLAEIIKLRVFDGISEREAAEILGISRKRLQKQWVTARSLLTHLLGAEKEARNGTF